MYRLRSDLQRAVLGRFSLPLGILPGRVQAPVEGYTIAYTAGEDDEPDSYSFYVTVSHERIRPILHQAFEVLLPESVFGLVEISSRDAYRSLDVFVGGDPVPKKRFLASWRQCESVLLEDGTIGAGANFEDPYIEVFLDQWKGIAIIAPLGMRDQVESMLHAAGIEEVAQTWPDGDDEEVFATSEIRPVLDEGDGRPDIDDLLLDLRAEWRLELNVDPDRNIDDAGRELGLTLWHAVVGVVDPRRSVADADVSIWATAGSLSDVELLIDTALSDWETTEVYMVDRVAFDERPEELSDLPPRRDRAEVHLVQIEPRQTRPPDEARG